VLVSSGLVVLIKNKSDEVSEVSVFVRGLERLFIRVLNIPVPLVSMLSLPRSTVLRALSVRSSGILEPLTRKLATKSNETNVPEPANGFEVKPKAYAPPMPNSNLDIPESKVPYVPKEKHQRVTFEYPDAPRGRDDLVKPRSRWRPVIPIFVGVLGAGWALYTYNYFTDDTPNEYLHPDKFIPFLITGKVDIDKDHYLIEVKPKYNRWKTNGNDPKIWNGSKLWSVEVKQPQIMVVRRYTPLPLEIHNSATEESKPIIRVQTEEDAKDGKLVFYIKKYDQGEVARWIYKKPLGSELELRGPYVEFEFPKSLNNNFERPQFQNLPSQIAADPKFPINPDNLVFFAAGTGIAPALQMMLSRNPYKGFIDVFYSRRTASELPIPNYFYFLEKLDRAKFHHLIQENGDALALKHVPAPTESNLIQYQNNLDAQREASIVQKLKGLESSKESPSAPVSEEQKFNSALEQAQFLKNQPKQNPSLAIVCGPDGYLNYVSGLRPHEGQGKVTGLLKDKGWNESNVFKM
jgi:NAD(P)H-flavin reductase